MQKIIKKKEGGGGGLKVQIKSGDLQYFIKLTKLPIYAKLKK
jgi:hypothetical protein